VTVETQTRTAAAAKKLVDYLIRHSIMSMEQKALLAEHMTRAPNDRVEEALLDLGCVDEPQLLKALATIYKANFVSTEKLSKADIPRATLEMIPRRFAEATHMCPVMFDQKAHVLSVVMADAENSDALREAQIASGAREVKAIVARPAAVKAAIAKWYGGDARAFSRLDLRSTGAHQMFYGGHNMLEEAPTGEGLVREPARRRPSSTETSVAPPLTPMPVAPPPPAPSPPPLPTRASATDRAETLTLLNVLVSLLEQPRNELRGHSAQVSRLVRRMAERMSIDANATRALVAAAYVHDLGKMGQFHLTALNCAEYEGHRVAAQKAHGIPARLLEPVKLSKETVDAVVHMYERYDGKGFPDGMVGKDIPLGARILSLCDTYADLTENPRNPFRRKLTAEDACAVLVKYKDQFFDPNIVDLFRHMVLGEDIKQRLLANRYSTLIVDTDPEETTVVELRLLEQGFVVKTARSSDVALKMMQETEFDLVVSELELAPQDGLTLLKEARGQPWGSQVAWVFYARKQERAAAQQAFALGALDFVAKPASTDVLVAKLKAMLDQRATSHSGRGVSGSLEEMGLADLVQVLSQARKTGSLKIRSRGEVGEIHFQDGNVVHALRGELQAEPAFYAMVRLTEGDFALDPSFKPTVRTIQQSAEALLLEAMRRMDEGIA
jgi:response regulator RpfG family c-di-GMP phosphodiesterase